MKSNINKTVNIGFVINKLIVGGTENHLVELINRLDRSKFNPILFVLIRHDDNLELINKVNCKIFFLDVKGICHLSTVWKGIDFIKLLKKNNVDILQCFFPDSSLLGTCIGKIVGVPLVIASRRDLGYWLRRIEKIEYRIAAILSDKILVNSRAVRDSVMEADGVKASKIDVIYNGINLSLYESILSSKKVFSDIIEVGIISNFDRKVKRLDVFIESMIKVAKQYDNVKFTVVGRVEWEHWNVSIPLELKDKFNFVGSSSCVYKYLKFFDIAVNCSDSEGFSNVVMEYMASGIPVICSCAGGNIELITDGEDGFLFTPGDCDDLASQVLKLIYSEALREEVARNAYLKVTKFFYWSYIIKEYEEYYLAALS